MSLIAALALYVIFLGIYWFFVLSILWHVREYTLPIDYSVWIIRSFLAAIILLNIVSLFLFFNLPFGA